MSDCRSKRILVLDGVAKQRVSPTVEVRRCTLQGECSKRRCASRISVCTLVVIKAMVIRTCWRACGCEQVKYLALI